MLKAALNKPVTIAGRNHDTFDDTGFRITPLEDRVRVHCGVLNGPTAPLCIEPDPDSARQVAYALLLAADATERAQRERQGRQAALETEVETAQRIYGWDAMQAVSTTLINALGADGLKDLHNYLTTGSDISVTTRDGLQQLALDVTKRDYTPPTFGKGDDIGDLRKTAGQLRSEAGYTLEQQARINLLSQQHMTTQELKSLCSKQELGMVATFDNVEVYLLKREGLNGITPEDLVTRANKAIGANWISGQFRNYLTYRAAGTIKRFLPGGDLYIKPKPVLAQKGH